MDWKFPQQHVMSDKAVHDLSRQSLEAGGGGGAHGGGCWTMLYTSCSGHSFDPHCLVAVKSHCRMIMSQRADLEFCPPRRPARVA